MMENGFMEQPNVPTAESGATPRRLPVWVILTAFVVLLAFLALIAWGLRRAMSGSIQVGDTVPDIQMVTFDGQTIHSKDLAGKVIVINFWASWCKPCEQEAADLEEAYQQLSSTGEVAFLGLAYVDTESHSLEYLDKFGITYPNGPDLRTTVSQMFRITGVPETYVIGPDGSLKYVKVGPFGSTSEILAAIQPFIP
jgi:cytochrome c biogenesis protein CcmG/thiol:disulfide interchange protein DsbE